MALHYCPSNRGAITAKAMKEQFAIGTNQERQCCCGQFTIFTLNRVAQSLSVVLQIKLCLANFQTPPTTPSQVLVILNIIGWELNSRDIK